MPLPIYIVAPPGARTDTLSSEDLADSVSRIESVEALGDLAGTTNNEPVPVSWTRGRPNQAAFRVSS
jgi:hypothetical protein